VREPPTDLSTASLRQALEDDYGLKVSTVTFLPLGHDSLAWVYRAETHSGDAYFVKARTANGTVTEWEPHGIGCAICLDVGRDAMSLFNTGSSVQQIRAAIEKKYASHFPSSTPTPRP